GTCDSHKRIVANLLPSSIFAGFIARSKAWVSDYELPSAQTSLAPGVLQRSRSGLPPSRSCRTTGAKGQRERCPVAPHFCHFCDSFSLVSVRETCHNRRHRKEGSLCFTLCRCCYLPRR